MRKNVENIINEIVPKINLSPFIEKQINDVKDIFRRNKKIPNRVLTKIWRCMLIHNLDTVVVNGTVRKIKGKSIGAGVYELSLEDE